MTPDPRSRIARPLRSADEATADAYHAVGLPKTWAHVVDDWARTGFTPADAAPWLVCLTTGTMLVRDPHHIARYTRHAITPADVTGYRRAGVGIDTPDLVIRLHRLGCPPDVVAANGSPMWCVILYKRVLDEARHVPRDLVDAYLTHATYPRDRWQPTVDALQHWATWHPRLTADRLALLLRAGITPTEVTAHPELLDVPADHLATLAALHPTSSARHAA